MTDHTQAVPRVNHGSTHLIDVGMAFTLAGLADLGAGLISAGRQGKRGWEYWFDVEDRRCTQIKKNGARCGGKPRVEDCAPERYVPGVTTLCCSHEVRR